MDARISVINANQIQACNSSKRCREVAAVLRCYHSASFNPSRLPSSSKSSLSTNQSFQIHNTQLTVCAQPSRVPVRGFTANRSQSSKSSQSSTDSCHPSIFAKVQLQALKPSSILFSKSNLITRNLATAAVSVDQATISASSNHSSSNSTTTRDEPAPTITKPIVAYHLFFLAFLVYAIVVVGGLTRLTESGLSITEWNPGLKGMRLPSGDQEWEKEWDKYKATPEFVL